jgi:hypothetical protein
VHGRSLGDALSLVKSDAEISPPLYFVLAWFSTHLGSGADLIRLPALIAGLASIPLAFLLARRMFGYSAGLAAAALMALNPFMVFYSTDGRAYTVVIALLLASTLVMLIAAERGNAGWWAAYAVLVALAMYTHYTAAFILGAQLVWLLWARPEVRVAALVATAAAAIAYLPWVPGAIDDSRSPTVNILSALQGDGVAVKLQAIGNWAFGYPYNSTDRLPGQIPLVIGIAAVALLAAAAGFRLISELREKGGFRRPSERVQALALAAAIALATPIAEAVILLAGGTDLLGARNLNTASGGFAVLIAGMAVTAGPAIGSACLAALIGVFAIGTAKSLDPARSTIDFRDAAQFINEHATRGDAVVDPLSTQLSPVPTTPISADLRDDLPLFNLNQPPGSPPLLRPCPPRRPILREAMSSARGHRIFLVGPQGAARATGDGASITLKGATICVTPTGQPEFGDLVVDLPGWRLEGSRVFEGLGPVYVDILRAPQKPARP